MESYLIDFSEIQNRPTHTSNLTNDSVGTGSPFVTASGLINTIKLGSDLANVANGASDNNIANSLLAYLSDTSSWTPSKHYSKWCFNYFIWY